MTANLAELLARRAIDEPDRVAFGFVGDEGAPPDVLTYRTLDQRVRCLAARLREVASEHDRALLVFKPGPEFIEAFFACLYAGVVAVPVYPPRRGAAPAAHPSHPLRGITESARPSVVLSTGDFADTREKLEYDDPLGHVPWLYVDEAIEPVPAWTSSSLPSLSSLRDDRVALLQYTSGSTAMPKGVMVTHGNLMANQRALQRAFGKGREGAGVGWLPPYHDMGLIGMLLHAVYVGAPLYVLSPVQFLLRPLRWLREITRWQATMSGGPNFAYELCAEQAMAKPEQCRGLDLSAWTIAACGSEPIRPDTLRRFAATFAPYGFRPEAFCPCYGLAEATLFAAGSRPGMRPTVQSFDAAQLEAGLAASGADRELVGCGGAPLEHRIVIVDPRTGTKCPEGRVGEIWLAGPSVAAGYWAQPDATKSTFRAVLADEPEGPAFLRTGDWGFTVQGELFITGRVKDLLIVRGRNVYPQDIELTVERVDPVLRPNSGAAFSLPGDDESICVVQEVDTRKRVDLPSLVRAIRERVTLAHDVALAGVTLIRPATMARTSSGKIQRSSCRDAFQRGTLSVVFDWQRGSENSENCENCANSENEEESSRDQSGARSVDQGPNRAADRGQARGDRPAGPI